MSDALSQQQIEDLKARDVRIRALDTALLVEQELRDSKTLHLLMQAIEDDATDAMNEFADANPYDAMAIGALQARMHRLVYLRRTIAMIRQAGDAASAALQAEDDLTPIE
jgi:hypothetical protein